MIANERKRDVHAENTGSVFWKTFLHQTMIIGRNTRTWFSESRPH